MVLLTLTAAWRPGCACEGALLMLWLVGMVGLLAGIGVFALSVWDVRRQRGAGK